MAYDSTLCYGYAIRYGLDAKWKVLVTTVRGRVRVRVLERVRCGWVLLPLLPPQVANALANAMPSWAGLSGGAREGAGRLRGRLMHLQMH